MIKAPTTTLNPGVDPDFLADAYADDSVAAAAEYGANWREDISAFISADVVNRITVTNRTEIPPEAGITYTAFVDVGGGTGGDSYTAAIAHHRMMEGSPETCAVLDLLFEVKPPYSPDEVTATLCEILKRYRISSVVGDNYGGAWPRERFAHNGIKYEPATKINISRLLSQDDNKSAALHASEIYRTFLALANSGRVELLDHVKMRTQLLMLERRTTPSGADSITHPKGGHDDCINAAAGACVVAAHSVRRKMVWEDPAYLARLKQQDEMRLQRQSMGIYGRNEYWGRR